MQHIIGLFALSLAFTATVANATSIHVKANQNYVIQASEANIKLTSLIMEDGASISFAPEVNNWTVYASKASFGNDVVINASGLSGGDGVKGPATPQADNCQDGSNGSDGGTGIDGQSGISLDMTIGLIKFESLKIISAGGTGGKGGQGGDGAKGGENVAGKESRHCVPNGGSGGQGGSGGNGGNGGDIHLKYWSADKKSFIPISNYGPGIQVITVGANGGIAGDAGIGGPGGGGGYTQRGSIVISIPEGDDGIDGINGVMGTDGTDGKFLIQPILPPK